jgi:heat shock protein HtpX
MSIAYTEISRNKFRTWVFLALFVGFVMALGFVMGESYYPGGGISGLLMAGGVAGLWTVFSYYQGDQITLKANGAHAVRRSSHPELFRIIENLSITAGLPMPKVYVIESAALNAFATGRDPEHASVAVTTGLLERLDKKELEGVLAHELSHVGNYDIRLLLVVTALAGVVMIMHDMFWRVRFFGGGNRRSGGKAGAALMLLSVVLLLLAPLFASLIKLAISRKREYLADASGALLTRYPEGLAGALEKIAQDNRPMDKASKGAAHLYFSNPFKSGSWSTLFSTHPPIEERIRRLRGMDM